MNKLQQIKIELDNVDCERIEIQKELVHILYDNKDELSILIENSCLLEKVLFLYDRSLKKHYETLLKFESACEELIECIEELR